jgi:hypothetical protein
MGRFYYGDIEGKFWVAIQPSNDIENIVDVDPEPLFVWKICNCEAIINESQTDKYCNSCFESEEEHKQSVIDDDDYDDERLYIEEEMISYCLNMDDHYESLVRNMGELKLLIENNIINKFYEIKQNKDILDTSTGVFNDIIDYIFKNDNFESDEDRKLVLERVTRYIIGYQIEYCLRTNESCNVVCEC